MAYTFDSNTVSDLHKDARGFRPSEYFWEEWTQVGDAGRQMIWDSLLRELNDTMAEDRRREADALARFEDLLARTRQAGAADDETAVRWILEGEQFEEHDYWYGADYCAFHFGLNYSNPYKDLFNRVCQAQYRRVA
jgi:hypothetical protein